MGIQNWFGFQTNSPLLTGNGYSHPELPELFPLDILEADFIKIDVFTIYQKILTDVIDRTQGISDDQKKTFWDSALKGSNRDGLITMIARAMAEKVTMAIVYDPATNMVRKATNEEQGRIKTDYDREAQSALGILISFQQYTRTDMLRIYSAMEYYTVSSLSKGLNVSKAIQIKMNELRSSVANLDSETVIAQARSVAQHLASGRDILLDSKDTIEMATPPMEATKEAISFLDNKRAFYLGLPASYITGIQSAGLSATGEGDQKAVERGLKNYFHSVVKPILDTLFGIDVTYKSQDFRQITQALDALRTFDLVSEEMLSVDEKRLIIRSLLDMSDDAD